MILQVNSSFKLSKQIVYPVTSTVNFAQCGYESDILFSFTNGTASIWLNTVYTNPNHTYFRILCFQSSE